MKRRWKRWRWLVGKRGSLTSSRDFPRRSHGCTLHVCARVHYVVLPTLPPLLSGIEWVKRAVGVGGRGGSNPSPPVAYAIATHPPTQLSHPVVEASIDRSMFFSLSLFLVSRYFSLFYSLLRELPLLPSSFIFPLFICARARTRLYREHSLFVRIIMLLLCVYFRRFEYYIGRSTVVFAADFSSMIIRNRKRKYPLPGWD